MNRRAPLIIAVLIALLASPWPSGMVSAVQSSVDPIAGQVTPQVADAVVAEPLAPLAGAPSIVSYQGQVIVGRSAYDGPGYFKFQVVQDLLATCTMFWSNDGTGTCTEEPKSSVLVNVSNGLFDVLLGSGMEPLTADALSGTVRSLRVWFSESGTAGTFVQLSPDQRVAAVPYALQATNAKTLDGKQASELQTRVSGACAVGSTVRAINPDGTVECEAHDAYPIFSRATVAADASWDHSMTIGADGLPVISMMDTSSRLAVVHCGDPACTSGAITTTIVDSEGQVGRDSSIAIGADGNPLISYVDLTTTRLKVLRCGNVACTVVDSTATVSAAGVNVRDTSIAIGYDGMPVISFSGDGHLKVLYCASATCTGNYFLTSEAGWGAGQYSSITIGVHGWPVISYYSGLASNEVRVLYCGNPYCNAPNNSMRAVAADQDLANATSITTGADGLPLISYTDYDYTNYTGTLRVVHCGDRACTSGVTVTPIDVGNAGANAITIGSDGLPVLAVSSDGEMRVVHCGNAACTAGNTWAPVDTANGSPSASITLGMDGLPLLSYHRMQTGELKVLHCSNAFGVPYWRRR